jgi:hypothetical protein
MKKIIVLTLSVLCSALVFANGTDDPSKVASSVVVLNSNGSNLVKVFYKSPQLGNVKISILNEQQELIFSETLRKMDGFMRPYNFDALPEGTYMIQIEDVYGKQVEKLNYHTGKTEKFVHLAKLLGQKGKYVLTGLSQQEDEIQVRIYDANNQLVFEENRKVTGEFGEVYNLKNISGSFTIEVADSHGVLKSLHY